MIETDKVEAWRQREVQDLGAALSCRDWYMMETAYNALRDKIDRELTEQHLAAKVAARRKETTMTNGSTTPEGLGG